MSVTRKDYGESAVIKQGNSTIKRISNINAPNSVQANGADKGGRIIKNYDEVELGHTVLMGNRRERVSEVNKTDDILDDIKTEYRNRTDDLIENSYTKADLQNRGDIVVVK